MLIADIQQQYVGCYIDDDKDRAMTGSVDVLANNSIKMTLDICQQYCQQSTETYFGVEVQLCVSATLCKITEFNFHCIDVTKMSTVEWNTKR